MADIKFFITAKGITKTKTNVKARDFNIVVDEPQSLGRGGRRPESGGVSFGGICRGVSTCWGHLIADEMGFALNGLDIDI